MASARRALPSALSLSPQIGPTGSERARQSLGRKGKLVATQQISSDRREILPATLERSHKRALLMLAKTLAKTSAKTSDKTNDKDTCEP